MWLMATGNSGPHLGCALCLKIQYLDDFNFATGEYSLSTVVRHEVILTKYANWLECGIEVWQA